MEYASVVLPTDKYDFAPLTDLKKRIEDELSGMSAEFAAILEQKMADALRKQREEEERIEEAAALAAKRKKEEADLAAKREKEEAAEREKEQKKAKNMYTEIMSC